MVCIARPTPAWIQIPPSAAGRSYIVDFVCFEANLIIELDGGQHGFDENLAADAARTAYLQSEGFRVMRYWNMELIENFDGAMVGICQELGIQ